MFRGLKQAKYTAYPSIEYSAMSLVNPMSVVFGCIAAVRLLDAMSSCKQ